MNSGLTKTDTESTHGRGVCNSDSYKREQNLIGGIEVYNGEEYCKGAYCLGAVQLLSIVSGKLLKQVPFTIPLKNTGYAPAKNMAIDILLKLNLCN